MPFRHVNADHITELIKNDHQQRCQDHHARQANLWATVIIVIVTLGFIAFLVNRLADTNAELLKDLVKTMAIFVGGFGFGAVAGARFTRRPSEKSEDDQ